MTEAVPFNPSSTENDSTPEEFWEQVFARFRAADIPEDFMRDRPMNEMLEPCDIFGDDEQLNTEP